MPAFRLTYTLTRRQRLAVELPPWLPAIAATVGFGFGAAYAGLYASPWMLLLLAIPPLVYRGLFEFGLSVALNTDRAVELLADGTELEVRAADDVRRLPLAGVFQVFRTGDAWTVLHLDGTVLTIPAGAITDGQISYLRTFARRAAAARAE